MVVTPCNVLSPYVQPGPLTCCSPTEHGKGEACHSCHLISKDRVSAERVLPRSSLQMRPALVAARQQPGRHAEVQESRAGLCPSDPVGQGASEAAALRGLVPRLQKADAAGAPRWAGPRRQASTVHPALGLHRDRVSAQLLRTRRAPRGRAGAAVLAHRCACARQQEQGRHVARGSDRFDGRTISVQPRASKAKSLHSRL